MSYAISPLARAVMDSFAEGVVVFDQQGQLLYMNQLAESAVQSLFREELPCSARDLMPQFAEVGARVAALRDGNEDIGEAVYLPVGDAAEHTLAERERQAILETLEATGWRLAASARRLGISRTTLWRRLKEYGLQKDGRGRWSRPS